MQLNAFGAALLRRWYLVVLSFGLAVGASTYIVSTVGPTYTVEGTVMLFPPTSSTTSGDHSVTKGNPYLYLGGLNPARDVLIRSLTSRSERDNFAAAHPDADYTMDPDISTSGPLIVMDVSSGGSEESVAALNALLDRIPAALDALQADTGIDSDDYITSQTLTADDRPQVVHKSQIRAGIVTGAGVLVLCLLLVGLIDGLLLSAAARAGAPKQVESDAAPEPEGSAPTAGSGPPDADVVEHPPPDEPDDTASADETQVARAASPARPATQSRPRGKGRKQPRPRPRGGNLSSVG